MRPALRGHASPTSHPVRTARAVMPGPLCRPLPPPALPPAPASSGPRVERAPAAARSARRAGAQLCAATRAGFALSLFLVLGGGGVAAAAVVAGGGGADGRVRRGARGGPGRLQRRVPRQAQGRRARGRQRCSAGAAAASAACARSARSSTCSAASATPNIVALIAYSDDHGACVRRSLLIIIS